MTVPSAGIPFSLLLDSSPNPNSLSLSCSQPMCLHLVPVHQAPPPCASLRRSTFKWYREHYILVLLRTRASSLGAGAGSFFSLPPWYLHGPWIKGGLCIQCPNLLQYVPPPSPLADLSPGSGSLGRCRTLRQGKCGLGPLPSFYSAAFFLFSLRLLLTVPNSLLLNSFPPYQSMLSE